MVVNEVRFPHITPARAAAAVVVDNPMRKLSIFMLLLFLFLTHSRLLEVVYVPSLALVLAILAMMGATMGGDMGGAVKSRIGSLLFGFTIWAIITVPFSVWPGGSVGLLKDVWLKNVMVFYMIGAVLLTAADCRKAFKIMAFGTALMVVLSFKYANMSSGRLAFGEGTLGNPNDFAAYLLVGAAFCVYGLMRSGTFMRVFWVGILLVLMMQFLKTGSRGGLIALAVLVLYLVWKASVTTKAMMVVAMVGAIATAPVVLPKSVLERYSTIFGGGEQEAETRQVDLAESSTESRSMLLRRSIELTARNPILGVGIGQFNVAVADAMKDEGQRGHYLQTHNMYTQVSSETGLPGFILYMAALWHAIGGLRVVRKQASVLNPDLAAMANCLQGAWIVFLTSSAFASVAYHLQAVTLFGFSYALRHALTSDQVTAAASRRPRPVPLRNEVVERVGR